MRLLIEHGADPMLTTEKGVNALMAAAGQGWRYGDSQIPEADAMQGVTYCVELGLDINAINQKKETALHGAADRGADTIVQYLVDKGAKVDARDDRGNTAFDIASGGEFRGHPGYPSTAALLRKLIASDSR
jgi:ankyrin repeat protein